MTTVHVKICGVTSVDDALAAVEAGASSIGLNFVPASPRFVDVAAARAIVEAVGDTALVVAVVANLSEGEILALRRAVGLGCVQLHGDEPPELVAALLPHAYKAIRVAGPEDVARAERYPGDYLLVDAKVEGMLGGSGVRVDPELVAGLARTRRLTLAGGLDPDNVVEAIERVRPFAVDVASGVESRATPRRKDVARMVAFVRAARSVL